MIRFEDVSIRYGKRTVLCHVNLHIPEGELCVVVGRTGSGKSTLIRAVNGHVPHFTGATMAGRITVAGRDTRSHRPRDLADVVGVVGQDPTAGFVTDLVEDELAYGMESLGIAPPVMRKRVEETLDLLGLADLRQRPLRTLSGGQRQRVAIGSVLTSHPSVLVLDEPTSALDPGAAEEVLASLHRLVHDLGLTVLLAEHRLERVVHLADRVVVVDHAGTVTSGSPPVILATSPVAPPVVELGRLAGWSPLPLSVRDARRLASPLRAALDAAVTGDPRTDSPPAVDPPTPEGSTPGRRQPVPGELRDLTVQRGGRPVLVGVSLAFHPGQITAVMGRNGAGKSTLFAALVGLIAPSSGSARVGGRAPESLSARDLLAQVGLVPQEPADLLLAETVVDECAAADHDGGAPAGSAAALLHSFLPGIPAEAHPRDLSIGQQLALALAIVLVAQPALVLLDEPTRGLDYPTKRALVEILTAQAKAGACVVVATHDVELVAELASRVVVLADSEVVADGSTTEIVVSSPAFAPQVSKILAPGPWLTVAQVDAAMRAGR